MIPLIVVLPFLFAFLIILSSILYRERYLLRLLFLLGIFTPWIIFYIYLVQGPLDMVVGGWEQISGIQVAIDTNNEYFILGELLLFSGVSIYLIRYLESERNNPSVSPYALYPLVLIFHGSILGSFLARDIFNFFVYMEITSLCSIILVAVSNQKGSKIASFRYLILYFLSSFFFVFSIGLIYIKTGYLNLPLIREALLNQSVSVEVKIAMTMAVIALITKAGIFPIYFLIPEAYSRSDNPITALLSGMGGKVQIFGLVLLMIFLPFNIISEQMKILAFSSMIFGVSIALFQDNIKKVFAYSSISQMGYIFLSITLIERRAAIYHSFIHALSIGGLFLCAGILIESYGTKWLDELSYRNNKFLMIVTVLLSLSIIGVPPFLMSYNKMLVAEALEGGWLYIFYGVTLGTTMVFVRLNYKLFSEPINGEIEFDIHLMKIIVPLIFALIMIAAGIYINFELTQSDFFILSFAILLFALLNHIDLFERDIPEPFATDLKGLTKEINYYTAVFLLVNILVLIQFVY